MLNQRLRSHLHLVYPTFHLTYQILNLALVLKMQYFSYQDVLWTTTASSPAQTMLSRTVGRSHLALPFCDCCSCLHLG